MSRRTFKHYVGAFVAADSLNKRGFPVNASLYLQVSEGFDLYGFGKIKAAAKPLIAKLDAARKKAGLQVES